MTEARIVTQRKLNICRVFLKRRPKKEDLRPKTPWTKTKTLWTKTKTPVDKTLTPIYECCGISSALFNCDNEVYHSPFLLSIACSSVLKCRTIVSINTFTKQNNRRREEITTRQLTLMNSRRGESRALFITLYLINRKKAVDPEHHLSKGVHFGFHVSKVHLYFCRVIFISLLLYSDLYCYSDNCSKK